MKGDFSRLSFEEQKHYDAVLMQQGRVLTDADWNEEQAIQAHLRETGMTDVVGWSGVPKEGGGFQIGVTGGGQQLSIGNGRLYAGGTLCENDLTSVVTPAKPSAGGRYLVYLDAWKRHVTAIEDPQIRESALGGPDTTTRLQSFWQIRLSPNPVTGCDAIDADTPPVPSPSGMMRAYHDPVSTSSNLCALPATSGYLGLENQFYRVEIHRSGERDNAGNRATFKWSRENGSVATYVTAAVSPVVTVQDLGRDEVLGFANDHWVELIDLPMELNDGHGALLQIDKIDPSKREITMKTAVPALDMSRPVRLRRWDQSGSGATGEGIALGAGPIELENGIKIEFSAGTYRAGDYWVFAARTALNPGANPAEGGTLEWPKDSSNQALLAKPHGIEHQYAPLALVDYNSATQQFTVVSDCRPMFPALTEITASDVSFDNATCALEGVTTVQEAINILCQRNGTGCTLEVVPGQDLAAAFAGLPDGTDAQICLHAGVYDLDVPALLNNKGNILLRGAGPGTRIVAAGSETALRFENCHSVSVRDLYAESGKLGSGQPATEHLNGTLTFLNCPRVTVENSSLKCASGLTRAAACLAVRNPQAPTTPAEVARIRGCNLQVGNRQVGLLLVNVSRSQIEDNLVQTVPAPQPPANWWENKLYRGLVMKAVMSNLTITDAGASPPPETNASVNFGEFTAHFATASSLVPHRFNNPWKTLFAAHPLSQPADAMAVNAHVKDTIEAILKAEGGAASDAPAAIRAVITETAQPELASASQGIVIGGQRAGDVRVLDNTVQNVIQGIHLGLSHAEPAPGQPDVLTAALIVGNTVNVLLPGLALGERHGIFVGNCRSLVIENNFVTCQRGKNTLNMRIEGIKVYGHVDRRVIVRSNHMTGFTIGVHFTPLTTFPRPLWIITDNVSVQAAQAVQILPDPDPSWSVDRRNSHLARRAQVTALVSGLSGNFA
ncbi:MAG: DUF4815 domain-containing protein [Chloroflexi bacterium]|nr:DUF4815 domain-containing protein [Chloroflexota bacterium]MCI0578091.1 DUF4815 domain-containing protein [Chloroflexota bacterium]MCI0646079.1 DUF4815 domain-containing protein [Chloroflexota bacterium]MCI0730983.1 DUF4815 domain-containing protein [Chloroflexota bacterium]